jgi:hypothetical protein
VSSSLGSSSPQRMDCLALKMKVLQSFVKSGTTHPATHQIPGDLNFHFVFDCKDTKYAYKDI